MVRAENGQSRLRLISFQVLKFGAFDPHVGGGEPVEPHGVGIRRHRCAGMTPLDWRKSPESGVEESASGHTFVFT